MSHRAPAKPRVLVTAPSCCYRGRKGEVVRDRDGELHVKLDDGGAVLVFVWKEVCPIHEPRASQKLEKVEA